MCDPMTPTRLPSVGQLGTEIDLRSGKTRERASIALRIRANQVCVAWAGTRIQSRMMRQKDLEQQRIRHRDNKGCHYVHDLWFSSQPPRCGALSAKSLGKEQGKRQKGRRGRRRTTEDTHAVAAGGGVEV